MSWLNANDVFLMELDVRDRVDDLRSSVDLVLEVDRAGARSGVDQASDPSGDVPETVGHIARTRRHGVAVWCRPSAAVRVGT
jgi:hypothetical protein